MKKVNVFAPLANEVETKQTRSFLRLLDNLSVLHRVGALLFKSVIQVLLSIVAVPSVPATMA